MSSDRDDGRRHGGGADGTAGQGDEPSPGRGGSRLDELRARMRAVGNGASAASVSDKTGRVGLSLRQAPDTLPERDGTDGGRAAKALGTVAAPDDTLESGGDPALDGDALAFDAGSSLFGPDGPGSPRGRKRTPREQTPTQRALGLLTRREHSRKELTRKLTSRGLDRDEVVAAVDRLTDAGWQNDARFAESLIRSRAGNGYGPVHIRAELGMHGLDSQAIADALQSYEGNWLENARDLARRRYGDDYFREPALRRKTADLLLRRGFDSETVRNANRSSDAD